MAGHAPYYSNRTMWRTAVNVFNETKKSGVNLDFRTYHAIMQSITTHGRKKDSSFRIRPRRHPERKPVVVDIASVPALGSWKPKEKEAAGTSNEEITEKVPDLTLGAGPKAPRPQSFIDSMRIAEETEKRPTPSLFDSVPFFKKANEPSPHAASVEKVFSQAEAPSKLKLDLPGVTLDPRAKQRFFFLKPEGSPTVVDTFAPAKQQTGPTVVDMSGTERKPQAPKVMSPSVLESAPETTDTAFTVQPSDRQRASLSVEDLPEDSVEAVQPPPVPTYDPSPEDDMEALTSRWERRREEEAKEQERLAAIEFERETRRRELQAIRLKNDEWAAQRGALHSAKTPPPSVDQTAYAIAFHPSDDASYQSYLDAKSNKTLTADHVRSLLRRLSSKGKLDNMEKVIGDVGAAAVEGTDAALLHYTLVLQYQTGAYDMALETFQELERKNVHVQRRAVGLALLASVRSDSAAGWQRAMDIFEKYKPITHDPLCLLELNMINALSEANVSGKDIRVKILELVRKIHARLRDSMNQIGKQHSTALMRAYVKAGDPGTSQSILKSFQAAGEADQVMYTNAIAGCSTEQIKEILATFFEEGIESDLLGAAMFAFVNRSLVHEAWAAFARASSSDKFEPRGRRLSAALLFSLEGDAEATEDHTRDVHNTLVKCGTYSDRFLQRIMPFLQKFAMDYELVEAMQSMQRVYARAVAPAHIAAYQHACATVGVDPVDFSQEEKPRKIIVEKEKVTDRIEAVESEEKAPEVVKAEEIEEKTEEVLKAADYDDQLMELAKTGDWAGAQALVAEMTKRRIKLSTFQYNCVLTAAREQKAVLDETFERMTAENAKFNSVTINLAMNAYARLGEFDTVWQIFEKAEAALRDATSYHLALSALQRVPDSSEKAIEIVQEMKQRGIRPTQKTLDALLKCTASRSWVHALKALQLAKALKGVTISAAHQAAVLENMESNNVENAKGVLEAVLASKAKKKGKKAA